MSTQAEHLAKSLAFIRTQETQMRKALRNQGVIVAIKHASTMIGELRTSNLAPKQYYELYIACFDALTQLSAYMKEDHKNHHLADVYEIVQYTGNILPRLYSMITVGSAFLATDDAPVNEVLKDMLEMSRGIQNPIRGLFLRYYLGQMTRSYLSYDLANGIKFTLTNLVEMNKLWVRLQHQGHSRERDQRTAERKELQIIVGSNLVRLAQLEGIDATMFRETILPQLNEQVIQCHDVLAQEYLLDAICQAFPAEFHIRTLDMYLETLTRLHPDTSLPTVFHSSITRLLQYSSEPAESPEHTDDEKRISPKASAASTAAIADGEAEATEEPKTEKPEHNDEAEESKDNEPETGDEAPTEDLKTDEDKVSEAVDELKIDENAEKSSAAEDSKEEPKSEEEPADPEPKSESKSEEKEIAPIEAQPPTPQEIKQELLENAVQSYWDTLMAIGRQVPVSDKAVIVADLLRLAHAIGRTDIEAPLKYVASSSDITASPEIEALLLSVFDSVPLLTVLSILQTFPNLLENQSLATKERVASRVLEECLASSTSISDYAVAQQVFDLFGLIIKSDTTKMAELLHLIGNGVDSLKLFQLAHKSLRAGGVPVVQKTYGVLSSVAIQTLKNNPTSSPTPSIDSPMFKFINRTIHDLATVGGLPELAFRHYILAAATADERGAEEATYEFFVQAFTLYEESISDSRAQYAALACAIGLLQKSVSFSKDNYDTLATRCTMYGSKLLRKPDQCHAVLLASHLWLPETEANEAPDRLLETLQKALKIADSTMDSEVSLDLFCDVLDRYLYFLLLEVPTITSEDVTELIKVVKANQEASGDAAVASSKRFDRILSYIHEEPAFNIVI